MHRSPTCPSWGLSCQPRQVITQHPSMLYYICTGQAAGTSSKLGQVRQRRKPDSLPAVLKSPVAWNLCAVELHTASGLSHPWPLSAS